MPPFAPATGFIDFNVAFDHYHSTHSNENKQLSSLIYERNRDAGHIHSKEITQAYDPEENMFLPDRFIKGDCPKCGAVDQYGDSCEKCGATKDGSCKPHKFPECAEAGTMQKQEEKKSSGCGCACKK